MFVQTTAFGEMRGAPSFDFDVGWELHVIYDCHLLWPDAYMLRPFSYINRRSFAQPTIDNFEAQNMLLRNCSCLHYNSSWHRLTKLPKAVVCTNTSAKLLFNLFRFFMLFHAFSTYNYFKATLFFCDHFKKPWDKYSKIAKSTKVKKWGFKRMQHF